MFGSLGVSRFVRGSRAEKMEFQSSPHRWLNSGRIAIFIGTAIASNNIVINCRCIVFTVVRSCNWSPRLMSRINCSLETRHRSKARRKTSPPGTACTLSRTFSRQLAATTSMYRLYKLPTGFSYSPVTTDPADGNRNFY